MPGRRERKAEAKLGQISSSARFLTETAKRTTRRLLAMKPAKDMTNSAHLNGFSDETTNASRFEPNGLDLKKRPASEDSALERHYTVKEIAEMWHLDEKMIRRIFGDEPGVVSIGSAESRFRRAYRTLRIPESVLVRVHRRLRRAG